MKVMASFNVMAAKKRSVVPLILTLAVIGLILAYGYFEARNFLLGPSLTVTSPQSGTTSNDSLVEISGRAERIAKIYLNNRQIFTSKDGSFSEPLILSAGYNIIEVKAEDGVGRQVKKTVEIVLE